MVFLVGIWMDTTNRQVNIYYLLIMTVNVRMMFYNQLIKFMQNNDKAGLLTGKVFGYGWKIHRNS